MMSNMFYQQNSSDSQINQAGHASAVANSSLETTPSPSRSNLSKSNCDHDSIYYTQHKSYSQEGQYSITAQKLKKTQQRAAIGPMTRLWLAYDSKPQAKVGTLSNQRQIKQLKTWNHVEAKAGLTQVCILTLASQRWCSGILVFVLAKPGLAELNLALPHWAACNISSSCLDKAPSPPACFLKMSWRRNTRVELANHSWYDEPLFQWRKPLAPVYVPFALSRHCKCRLVKKIKRNPGQMLDDFAASLNSDPPACTLAGTNRSTSILKRDSWSWHSTGESLRSKL